MVLVRAPDYETLAPLARKFQTALKGVPGVTDVDMKYTPGQPELRVAIDRDKAARAGVPIATVALALRTAIEGEEAGKLRQGKDDVPIRVRLAKTDRASMEDVLNMTIWTPSGPVALGDLATVGEGKHLRFRVRRDGADAGSAIAFGAGMRLDAYTHGGRFDVAFRLEENRWNGTVSPQLVVRRIYTADERFDELREWLVGEFRKPAAARQADAVAVFAELEIETAGLGRRHLLESERFRALLEREPALARAA
jgi:hypothetical protein